MLSPKRVLDLSIVQASNSEAILSYTEVGDGEGNVAKQDLRFGEHPMSWGGADLSFMQILPLEDSAIGKTRRIVIPLDRPEVGFQIDFQTISYRGNLRTAADPFPDPPATFPDPGEDGSPLGNIATLTIQDIPEPEELELDSPSEEDPATDPESREVLVTKERVHLWRPFPWAWTPWGKFGVYIGKKLGDVEVPE